MGGSNEVVETSDRRRLHLISGSIVCTLAYSLALLVVRNLIA